MAIPGRGGIPLFKRTRLAFFQLNELNGGPE